MITLNPRPSTHSRSASDPGLGGSVWPRTGNKNRLSARTKPNAHRVSKPSPQKHKKEVTPFKEMLAKFGAMKIGDRVSTKLLAKFRAMKISDGQKDEEVDHKMGNT